MKLFTLLLAISCISYIFAGDCAKSQNCSQCLKTTTKCNACHPKYTLSDGVCSTNASYVANCLSMNGTTTCGSCKKGYVLEIAANGTTTCTAEASAAATKKVDNCEFMVYKVTGTLKGCYGCKTGYNPGGWSTTGIMATTCTSGTATITGCANQYMSSSTVTVCGACEDGKIIDMYTANASQKACNAPSTANANASSSSPTTAPTNSGWTASATYAATCYPGYVWDAGTCVASSNILIISMVSLFAIIAHFM